MKILKKQILVAVMVLSSAIGLNGMIDVPILPRPSFFTGSIKDIQYFTQMHEKYPLIINNTNNFKIALSDLGLTLNNSPLDVRYNYDLLLKTLSKDEPSYKAVEDAYNLVIWVLSSYKEYQHELATLVAMDFDRIQNMEFSNKEINIFLNNKAKEISNVTNRLKHKLKITELLGLPDSTGYKLIHATYLHYIKNNDPNRLIALKTMNQIDSKELKRKMPTVKKGENLNKKMLRLEEIKKAYADYIDAIKTAQ
jgi:hypothetical protein